MREQMIRQKSVFGSDFLRGQRMYLHNKQQIGSRVNGDDDEGEGEGDGRLIHLIRRCRQLRIHNGFRQSNKD